MNTTPYKPISRCDKCGRIVHDLFKDGDSLVCCECKYGTPMTPQGHSPASMFTSRPQPINLDTYDKILK